MDNFIKNLHMKIDNIDIILSNHVYFYISLEK